ncbi:MAG: hypothetical protein A2700_02540 [Candidatus Blackburnbacteria bacterium RIFCSPHIGHO2_01_FULL_44_64]|nr:MAG: hypothetical protein A2700_02540 [Candidatus Blackburnbacteria bacterium RIFCSPHIGHO2_01_FULL_44_64]OGY14460.1 MAG: hypothetical protein A3A62_00285 [Candidatus Blackburnbacteria bacterium RIFCSPLOWO2_01_FULL_44_43]
MGLVLRGVFVMSQSADSNDVRQRLVDAEENLARAARRVRVLRGEMLCGHYNPDELDEAIKEYREAKAQAGKAHVAWIQARRQECRKRGTPQEAPPEALGISLPRVLFFRWLYETGRMSGWPESKVGKNAI